MKDLYYYPRYVTRWRESETRLRLTHEERSMYWEVIDYLYLNGGSIANVPEVLISATASDKRTFTRVWPNVKNLFVERDGRLYHPVVTKILTQQEDRSQKRASAGSLGGAKKASNARILLEQSSSSPCYSKTLPVLTNINTTTPPTPSSESGMELAPEQSAPKARGRERLFLEFWQVVWAKIGRGAALKAWNRKATSPEKARAIIAAAIAQGPKLVQDAASQGRAVLHPATWLNQDRYDDEVAPEPPTSAKYSSVGNDPNAFYVPPPKPPVAYYEEPDYDAT